MYRITQTNPTVVKTMVYKALTTILKYDNPIIGANEEVSKNKNAACPFGETTLGRFVPVLIATANLSN